MFDSESSSDGGWISWFCDLEGHEFFVEVSALYGLMTFKVDAEYLRDSFNLYGLKEKIPRFK
jgi:casein kinase II subunit beta